MADVANWTIKKEDQDALNEFSRVTMKKQKLEDQLFRAKESLQGCEDANAEIMMMADPCWISCAEFWELFTNEDQATARMDSIHDLYSKQVSSLQNELSVLESRARAVQTRLQGTMGDRVNLEMKKDYVKEERTR